MKNDEPVENKEEELRRLVKAVLKSSKYRNVCADFIRNLGERELSKQQNLRKAIKSTKNKLHQISGAYFLTRPNYRAWLEKLKRAKEAGDDAQFRQTCAEIMGYHYSTKERLKILDEFYTSIFSLLPQVRSIIDIACGFHPLSIPWMPLSGKVRYYAYDIYEDLTDFLNGFMSISDVEGCAETRDVLLNPPKTKTDLAFILNTMPCLEQIEKSAGLKILESTQADFLIVSFPVRSLGGRKKNMRRYYAARFNALTQGKDWEIRRLKFRTELVFLVRKE